MPLILRQHALNCEFRPVSCPYRKSGCRQQPLAYVAWLESGGVDKIFSTTFIKFSYFKLDYIAELHERCKALFRDLCLSLNLARLQLYKKYSYRLT